MLVVLLIALGCRPEEAPDPSVAWSSTRARLADDIGLVHGYTPLRSIVHLHSPYSHDACDGEGYIDGALDEACLADLRGALCQDAIDVAFATDHPDYGDRPPWEELLLSRAGDSPIEAGGVVIGNEIPCDDAVTMWLPGFEDELMPVALDEHVDPDQALRHGLLNGGGQATIDADHAAGGLVFVAHTEGRDLADLQVLQDRGIEGIELFNLHAMFAPDIRQEDLGLDPFSWLDDASPFFDPDGTAQPDLLFLAVLQEQAPSIAAWDALLQRGPMVAVGGSDAHQNAIPVELRDGERGDSYRRALGWFSNVLLAEGTGAADAAAALAAGRVYVAFEALGVPDGFEFRVVADDVSWPMGSDAPAGILQVGCPELSASSPRGPDDPEITVTIYKDGVPWQTGCGLFEADGPAVYRARVDIVPRHLEPFLGADPDPWMRPFPWVYGNAIRVSGG